MLKISVTAPDHLPSFTRKKQLPRRLAVILSASLLSTVPLTGQQPDRSRPPAPGPAPALKTPAVQKHTLSNGLPVWIVEMHEVPVVDVSVILRSGAAADAPDSPGVAHFTAAMLDEGAGSRTALELADAIDMLGASLTTASSYDATTVRLHSLVSKLDAALPLLADVTLRPTFPEADMERLRNERLTSLLQVRDNPSQLATNAFSRILYGLEHRYGTATMGTEASNKALTAASLRAFHAAHYQPQNAHVLVVGDVVAATVLPKLEAAFGTWKNGSAVPRVEVPQAKAPGSRHIYLLDKPGAAQSQIRIGAVGVARSTPDFHVIDVANTLLGGSFTSRLNQNLREEHGYTYGAGSQFAMRRAAGPFVALAGVQTDKTVESLVEFFKELDRMREPVPADELTRVKNLQALSFPSAFETTAAMAGQLGELVIYELPGAFFDEYVPKIQAVTSADVERAARQYLQTSHFIVVIAGDLATIEKPIRDAKIAPVTIVLPDEVLK